jgi:hypothetical protein
VRFTFRGRPNQLPICDAENEDIRGGSSYLSQNDLRLHFGLGKEATMSRVEISWPSGKKDVCRDLAAGFIYTIVEEGGVVQKALLAGENIGGNDQTSDRASPLQKRP